MILFSRKQNEYILKANRRWNFKVGAVRSGKSFVDIAHTIPERLRAVADKDGLNVILGVSKETVERNVLQPMRQEFTEALVGTINSRNIAMICGVPVYCLGAEKQSQVAKIQGASIKYCYGDEIAKWNEEVFVMLQSRLDKPYSRFDGACNPEYPTHWLKEFIDRDDIDAYIQKYTIFDNPFLDKGFVRSLCTEYRGTVYYDRYINGEWALAEGLIYPMFEDVLVDELPKDRPVEYALSLDYGTMNAFAGLLWARYGDVWYAVDEYYYSGRDTGMQKTDQQYASDMDEFVRPAFEWAEKEKHLGRLSGSYSIDTIIDPSAASFIALLNIRQGFYVIHADNEVLDGIRLTARALSGGKIKILRRLTNWKREIQGYTWDDRSQEDAPLKFNDHLMDAMRYFVKTKGIAEEHEEYHPLWNKLRRA